MEKSQKIILICCIILVIIIVSVLIAIFMLKEKQSQEEDPIFQFSGEGNPYDDSQLDNFDITIEGMNSEISSNIQNMDNFNYEFKKFIYLNGLVDADIATCASYVIEDGEMKINMQLNNPAKKDVLAIVYLGQDKYEFVTP